MKDFTGTIVLITILKLKKTPLFSSNCIIFN